MAKVLCAERPYAGRGNERVLVTVTCGEGTLGYDVRLASSAPTGLLARHLAGALGVREPLAYRMEIRPAGRVMDPDETLAQAGIWDGAWLVLR